MFLLHHILHNGIDVCTIYISLEKFIKEICDFHIPSKVNSTHPKTVHFHRKCFLCEHVPRHVGDLMKNHHWNGRLTSPTSFSEEWMRAEQAIQDFLNLTENYYPPARLRKNHCPCTLEGHLCENFKLNAPSRSKSNIYVSFHYKLYNQLGFQSGIEILDKVSTCK